MKKALMNASVASMIYKFNMRNIEILEDLGYTVDVACNFGKENPISQEEMTAFRTILQKKHIRVFETLCPRSLFAVKQMIATYKQLKSLADSGEYDLVHTQSPIGGGLCRLAFRKARKKGTKVIYQAHGFHFFKGASKINWIIFYPIEKLCSYFTDTLITINQEDYVLAKEKFHAKQIAYVPGIGVNIEQFTYTNKKYIRSELHIPDHATVILSIGELNANKNHEIIIRGLARLDKEERENIWYIIAGQGDLKDKLQYIARTLGIDKHVLFLGFRKDVASLCQEADIYAFPSLREGLSVALMEAMASGMPIICSRIRGNTDLVDLHGGYLFDPIHIESAVQALHHVLHLSRESLHQMGIYNEKKVKSFDVHVVDKALTNIYCN